MKNIWSRIGLAGLAAAMMLSLAACKSPTPQETGSGASNGPQVSGSSPVEEVNDPYASNKDLVVQEDDKPYGDNWATATGKDLVYNPGGNADGNEE